MTISTDPSAPLVVVVGATGAQGGSVVRNLAASDKPYRLRGLSRDPSKPNAIKLKELGVEVVRAEVAVGNDEAIARAFAGATVVFAVTDYWQHMSASRELAEGKLMVDAAVAVGARLLIWSGLESVSENSAGKYKHVAHFDSKAAVTAYARNKILTVDVQAGHYMTNILHPLMVPKKRPDGSFEWEQPPRSSDAIAPLPFIDTDHDYGLFVRYAIEDPELSIRGGTIHTYGEMLSNADAAAILNKVRGTNIDVTYIPTKDAYRAKLEQLGLPEHAILDFFDFGFMTDPKEGYYFGKQDSNAQQVIRAKLPRKPRTWEEFLVASPEFFSEAQS